MVTQLLFGETVKIYEEKKGDWRRIKTVFDDYDCWIDKKQITEISMDEFEQINTNSKKYSDFLKSDKEKSKTKTQRKTTW